MGRKKSFNKEDARTMALTDLKLVWGSVALQQALRAIGLTYDAIGAKMGVSKRTAWNNCNGIQGCIPWSERDDQEQLKEVAEFIINHY